VEKTVILDHGGSSLLVYTPKRMGPSLHQAVAARCLQISEAVHPKVSQEGVEAPGGA
jgi:hypothetical protein